MPHIVVKGKVDGTESVVFGLNQSQINRVKYNLIEWGGRVGQDGQSYNHSPLVVITRLEDLFGYRIVTSTMGTQKDAIWTLHRTY